MTVLPSACDLAIDLWRCFDAGRFRDVLPLLAAEFEALWPNTRERIRGPENFIALNEAYPGAWRCTVWRAEETREGAVTVTEITDGETALYAVSFFTARDGRLIRAEEYFADNTEPSFDRSAWAERY